jgi:hypothetical protein
MNPYFRRDTRLFTGIQRIIDGFLDRRQQCLAWVIETEKVAILGEKFADRNTLLVGRHGFGGCSSAARFSVACSSQRKELLKNMVQMGLLSNWPEFNINGLLFKRSGQNESIDYSDWIYAGTVGFNDCSTTGSGFAGQRDFFPHNDSRNQPKQINIFQM